MAVPEAMDWQALIQKLGPFALAALKLLLDQLLAKQMPYEANVVTCGPDGCQCCAECLDAATMAQVRALFW